MDDRPESELSDLRERLRAFAAERDWDQFHSPRNLATALAVEAAELLEPFRWARGGEMDELDDGVRRALAQEAADVLLTLVRFADKAGIDLYRAALEKLALNAQRYPAEQVRGSARKYRKDGAP